MRKKALNSRSSYAAVLLHWSLLALLFCSANTASAQCIAVFPYLEDFETSEGGWVSGGLANDWTWGTPSKLTINGAGSGLRCWITGGLSAAFYNFGQRSFVESPCFDFTQLPHPYISFKIWWESEDQYDGANLQYSLNNGTSWINVGSANESDCLSENWYNSSGITNLSTLTTSRNGWCGNIQPISGSCQGGNGSNGWVTAKHCLPMLGGKPNVRFRFIFGAGTTCNSFDGVAFDAIRIESAPAIVANFSSACSGFNAFVFTDLSDNCPDTWNWNFGDPASGSTNQSTAQNPSHTFSGPGIYQVSLQASSSCSGASSVTFPIEVLGLETSSTPPSCIGGTNGSASAEYALSGGPAVDYSWNTTPPQFGPTATHLTAGEYSVSVTGAGICPVSANVTVLAPTPAQTPVLNTLQALSDTTIALGNSVSLNGLLSDPGRVVQYQWEPELYLSCSDCLNPTATPLTSTTYRLTAIDSIGCSVSDALQIQVLQGSVYIPNVFKPAAENSNAVFTVFAARDVEKVESMQIYDRWGSLVFENQNFQASEAVSGWDGLIGSEEAASGVYFYHIEVRFLNGVLVQYDGDVTVLR